MIGKLSKKFITDLAPVVNDHRRDDQDIEDDEFNRDKLGKYLIHSSGISPKNIKLERFSDKLIPRELIFYKAFTISGMMIRFPSDDGERTVKLFGKK